MKYERAAAFDKLIERKMYRIFFRDLTVSTQNVFPFIFP